MQIPINFIKTIMDYDVHEDNFNCHVDEKLNIIKKRIFDGMKNEKNFEIERIYYNKEACAKCKHANRML